MADGIAELVQWPFGNPFKKASADEEEGSTEYQSQVCPKKLTIWTVDFSVSMLCLWASANVAVAKRRLGFIYLDSNQSLNYN